MKTTLGSVDNSNASQQPSPGGKKYWGMAKEATFSSQAPKPTFEHNASERTATKVSDAPCRPVADAESSKLGIPGKVRAAEGY